MFVVVYTIVRETGGMVRISGPYFGDIKDNEEDANMAAREIVNSHKGNSVIIAKTFKIEENLSNTTHTIRDIWFKKFKQRMAEAREVMAGNHSDNICPFKDIDICAVANTMFEAVR